MRFQIIGELTRVETIATGSGIREIARLQKDLWPRPLAKAQGDWPYPLGIWRACLAEIHWYEASGIGRKEFKIKALLESE